MNTKLFPVYILTIALISCNQAEKKQTEVSSQPNVTISFINPPLKNVDVPFTEYNVDAAKGDTIFYQSGSILLFPPNAFVDKNGNVIEGNIQIKYREFSNAVDLYLSGIPMSYDSAGNVSSQELELAIKTAIDLRRDVVAWLTQNHPELLKN